MHNNNITPQSFKISKKERTKRNGHRSFVIWLTGLSGSGKSTLANAIEQTLFEKKINTYVLDGDNTRLGINRDLSFTDADRKENIRRVAEIANLFTDAGIVTITSFISPFKEDRDIAKEIIGRDNFVEVFVDCSIEECEKRDVKGLYAKARKGEIKNFTGIDSDFEKPENPDLIVNTHTESLEACLSKVLKTVEKKINEI